MPASRSSHTRHQQPPTVSQGAVIVYALAAGVAVFTVIAAVLGPVEGPVEEAGEFGSSVEDIVVPLALVAGIVAPLMAVWFRGLLLRRASSDRAATLTALREGQLTQPLMTASIVPAAIAEASGLLAAVALLLTGQLWLLVVAVVSIATQLSFVPSQPRLIEAIETLPRGE